MSESLLERVRRLHNFAGLLHQELGGILQAMEEQGKGRAVSAVSTSPEEMAIMEQQLQASRTASTVLATPEGLKPFVGPQSHLVTYLSPLTMEGGRGFIKVSEHYKQYEECLRHSPVDSIINWPSGFYRNADTKETQLLIRGDEVAFVYDGLPSRNVSLFLVQYMEEEPTLKPVTQFTDEELKKFEVALLTCLEDMLSADSSE